MEEFYQRLAAVRHHIHQHPELSNQEVETSQYLREKLKALNIKILDSSLKTGLVAELGQGKPVIALRADIDALPILEKTGLDYASQNKGVMHACGHDFHQTSLLGAAELLKAQESDLKGTLRLIFQPAEEISEGATAVLETGLLDDVEAIIGFHNMPQLPAGVLALKEGGVLAGVEKFKVSVEGVSSHAKNGGNMGASGSVSYLFDNKGVVVFAGDDADSIFELLLEADVDVDDVEVEDGTVTVYTAPTDLHKAIVALRESGISEFQVTELEMIPQSEVELSGDDLATFEKLYDVLEDDEDVQKIYTNVDGF